MRPIHRAALNVDNISTFITTLLRLPTPTCSVFSGSRRRSIFYKSLNLIEAAKQIGCLPRWMREDANEFGKKKKSYTAAVARERRNIHLPASWTRSPPRSRRNPTVILTSLSLIWRARWSLEWVSSVTAALDSAPDTRVHYNSSDGNTGAVHGQTFLDLMQSYEYLNGTEATSGIAFTDVFGYLRMWKCTTGRLRQ